MVGRLAWALVAVGAACALGAAGGCVLLSSIDDFAVAGGAGGSGGSGAAGGGGTTGGEGGAGATGPTTGGGGTAGATTTSGPGGAGGGLDIGKPCKADPECSSGNCEQGVCCTTACTDVCKSCRAAHTGDFDGACAPVSLGGPDPNGKCVATDAAMCGDSGECDGAGACRKYGAETQCAPPTCMGTTQTNAKECDGKGTCATPMPATTPCEPYLCGPATCKTSCMATAECAANNYCAPPLCLAKQSNGEGCTTAVQCSSGFCKDGFCCDTACTGVCQSCALVKGTCSTVTDAIDADTCNANMGCMTLPCKCDAVGACVTGT